MTTSTPIQRTTSSSKGSSTKGEKDLQDITVTPHQYPSEKGEPGAFQNEAELLGDKAVAEAAHELSDGFVATDEERRRVLRKIDWMLLPLQSVVYTLTYLDKTSVNYAKLLDFQADLGISAGQYSWLGSIFYIGYLAATPVHSFLFQKFPLGRYLSVCVLLWGLTLILHAVAFNFASMVACRLFLGIMESAVTPGFILITGRFYKREEQVTRTAFWFSMNGWAQILGGVIAYGVLSQKPGTLPVWKELFVILGAITLLFGILTMLFLPSSPDTYALLTPRERLVAVDRVRSNNAGLRSRKIQTYQIKEAMFGDPRLLFLFLSIFTLDVANGGTSNFSSTIIASLGFDKRNTALLGMAAGFSEVVATVILVLLTKWTKTRSIPGIICLLISITGAAMMVGLPTSMGPARMGGYCLVMFFPMSSLILYSILSSSSVAGETKKITYNLWFALGYASGNIVGPQVYRPSDAPAYNNAKIATLATLVASLLFFVLLFAYHWYENKRRDRLYPNAAEEEKGPEFELSDLTDRERKSFRYPL